ncbi:MAG TPA: porin [Mucilaginibacter sp.]|nr:porin [Mucilaginibacter sp.]
MKTFYTKTILLLSFFSFTAIASKAQQNDDLINVLLKKNLITQQEADSIRSEQAIKEQKRLDKERENQHNITIGSRALQISGLVQARYQDFQQAGVNNAFDLHRARLDAKGNITDNWSYEVYTEFAASTKLLDAYTAYKFGDFLKISAGQFKVPLSYESLIGDSQLDFIDRSQTVEALAGRSKDVIGNQNGRDLGLQINGSFAKINDYYLFDYTLGVFNGAGYNVTTDNNNDKDFAGRFAIRPIKALSLGGSLYEGEDVPTGSTKSQVRNRYGFDGQFVSGPFSVAAEYLHGTDGAINRDGWYAQAGYYVIPKFLQLLGKYDTYDPNKVNPTDRTYIYTAGVNFVFNQWTKLSVDYLFRHEEAAVQINNDILEAQLQIAF